MIAEDSQCLVEAWKRITEQQPDLPFGLRHAKIVDAACPECALPPLMGTEGDQRRSFYVCHGHDRPWCRNDLIGLVFSGTVQSIELFQSRWSGRSSERVTVDLGNGCGVDVLVPCREGRQAGDRAHVAVSGGHWVLLQDVFSGNCRVVQAPAASPDVPAAAPPGDPDDLGRVVDGCSLRSLLRSDEESRHERGGIMRAKISFTPDQRAAVSAHWSRALRARVAASAERARRQVVLDAGPGDLDDGGSP